MVLVNAMYFKGLWVHQFDEDITCESDFWISEKESVKVPMMSNEDYFRMCHHNDLGATVLAMDYKVGHKIHSYFVRYGGCKLKQTNRCCENCPGSIMTVFPFHRVQD